MAQRLVRTLCPHCKQAVLTSENDMRILGIDKPVTIYKPVGCSECNNTGYKGRCGIHELVEVNDEVQVAIHSPDGEVAIEKVVRPYTPTIRDDGFSKVLEGKTSLEEVMRVTSGE